MDDDAAYSRTQLLADAYRIAWPIMAGYVVLGLPCGLLAQQAGLNWVMVLLMSALYYSGVGQFMVSNMLLAGNPLVAIMASVSLVSTRQLLYASSLARWCANASAPLVALFAATVTDESYGVNVARFERGGYSVRQATCVNVLCQASWVAGSVAGNVVGAAVSFPTAIASFAMTSIFICLLCSQERNAENAVAVLAGAAGVIACKCAGASGAAVLVGALAGVGCALAYGAVRDAWKARRP